MQQCIGTLDYRALFLQMGSCFVLFFGFVHEHDELCISHSCSQFHTIGFWIGLLDKKKNGCTQITISNIQINQLNKFYEKGLLLDLKLHTEH